jgi:ParB family chromosome partitioning protein
MGRGLAAILAVSSAPHVDDEMRELPLDAIVPNPRQPRGRFDSDSLQSLADSMRERGLLQPVLVRPRPDGMFELIAGERRWRAARLGGMERIPAVVRPSDDAHTLELALIENMAREDLNPVEEARACAALVEELGLTREAVGRRVGRSRVAVSNLIRLLELPDEALSLLESGKLSEGHGRALLLARDHDDRRRLARDAAREGWSVRALESRARDEARAGGRRRSKSSAAGRHPDQEEAMTEIADALGAALGADVRVRPRGAGYRAELVFESFEDALALARRIRPRAVA